MACVDSPMSYNKLHDFHVKRTSIDKSQKMFAYSTLIPPPCLNDVEGVRVYVTEINADLSTDFLSPHTIQDPAYVCYDVDVLQVRLDEPLLQSNESFCHQQCWHRQALLDCLNGIMQDYGSVESSQNFNSFKYNLMAVCNASMDLFFHGQNLFYEHFILDVTVHCLGYAMKSINDKLASLSGFRKFRPIFSPCVTYLLKVLNALRRAFELDDELTSSDLMNEKTVR